MTFVNKTRTSASIPKKLKSQRKYHLLPVYHLSKQSFLGREGIENSGSYKFADHIYQSTPKGYTAIGKFVDTTLLRLPSSRSFRNRYIYARDTILKSILEESKTTIVSVPSGVPRDCVEAACILRDNHPDKFRSVTFYCIDLDPEVAKIGRRFAKQHDLDNFNFITADAHDHNAYPENVDVISSLGYTEFITDGEMLDFINHCSKILTKDGALISTSTKSHRISTYLMENIAELQANYRDPSEVKKIINRSNMDSSEFISDKVGYQTLFTLRKS